MTLVNIQDDEIRLNSGFDEAAFGKTNYFTLLSKEGLVFDLEKNDFTPWQFEKINTYPTENSKTPLVHYCGKNPLSKNAKPLLDYFSPANEKTYDAAVLAAKAMTAAAEKDKIIPIVGAGGIIIDLSTNKALFLPEETFKYSTNHLSQEEYFNQHTGWINQTIEGIPAICYERSLIIYKLFTNHFPYAAIDETERNSDILDKNFLPMAQCFTDINIDFARAVNKGLRLNSTSVDIPGKKKKGIDSDELRPEPSFDFDLLKESWNFAQTLGLTDKDIDEKTAAYLKTRRAKVEAQRKLRRYFTTFMVAFFIAVLIIFLVISTQKKQNGKYTSKGLTSTEVIQGFFYGVNNKSIDLLPALVDGPAPEEYINKITNIYLLEKQMAAFTTDGLYTPPANWLFTITDEYRYNKVRVFGITNLTIDSVPQSLEVEVHRINQKPTPVATENNKTLSANDTIEHKVEYYLLQTNPETYEVQVQKQTDNFTLTYINHKWLITDITSDMEIVPVDTEKFKFDYFNSLTAHKGDPITAVNSLRERYPWLPTEETMLEEYSYLLSQQ